MSEHDGTPEEQGVFHRPFSRRSLVRGAAVGGLAIGTPALLAACGGDDDEEAAPQTETGQAAQRTDMTFYSVTHGESGNVFWAIYRKGIRDGAKAYGVEVKDLPLEQFSVAGYVDLLNQAIAARPDGIFCSILDQNAVDGPLRGAIEDGIPVIAVNVPDTRELSERIPYLFYVGGDEEAGGRLTAQRQIQEGQVQHAVCVIHEPGHTGLEARCRGYDAELKAAGARVDKLPSSKDATQATEQIKSFLQRNEVVDAIFGVGPQPATFALQALEELGRKGEV
jgi:simple sugar transport system substrate-binding protein